MTFVRFFFSFFLQDVFFAAIKFTFFSLSFVSFVLSYFILVFLLLSEIKKRWDERRFCICTAKWIEGEGVRLVDWLETWLERVAVVMWQILSFLYCSWMHIMSACVWRKLTCGERERKINFLHFSLSSEVKCRIMYSGAAASGIKSSSLSSSTSSSSPSITKHLYATSILWVRLTEIFLLKKHSSISFPIKTQTGDYFWEKKNCVTHKYHHHNAQ